LQRGIGKFAVPKRETSHIPVNCGRTIRINAKIYSAALCKAIGARYDGAAVENYASIYGR
jgi:hypothetical protein